MVPVKDTAGGTAFVFHNQAKRAPNQHANQIGDIIKYRNAKHDADIQNALVIQSAEHNVRPHPQKHHFIRRCRGICDIFF